MFQPRNLVQITGSQPRRALLGVAVITLIAAACGAALLDPGMLCVLPGLALPFLLLALDRYPGERTLMRLSAARRWPLRAPVRSSRPREVARSVPRGGLLIARSLAVRPPPLGSLAAA